MWFEALTGFREESPDQVRRNLSVDGTRLKSHVNKREYTCGWLQIPQITTLQINMTNLTNQFDEIKQTMNQSNERIIFWKQKIMFILM